MLLQLGDDISDISVLIENNGVAWKRVAILYLSDSLVFNENSITVSSQHCRSIDADAWCKRSLNIRVLMSIGKQADAVIKDKYLSSDLEPFEI